jgi:hypothetical protein
MGCYTAGWGYDVFANGLTSAIVDSLSLTPSSTYITSNGFYLLLYPSMTLELCISICQTNGFEYAGLQTAGGTE